MLAWSIQGRVIRALMLRDLMMRYGRGNIGFAWVVLEPMILTAGVMIIWSLMSNTKSGVKVVELVLTGYMPLTLWRHLTGSIINIFRNSSGLLYHRITLFDIIFARFAVEFLGTTAALLIVWLVLLSAGVVGDVRDLGLVLLGWLMMALIGFGAGLLIAATTEVSHTAERFVAPIQYLMVPLSGCFFLIDWMPTWAQYPLMLNPLVHTYEVFRAGYFGDTIITHYWLGYFFCWAFVLMFAGIVAVNKARPHVQLS